MYCKTVSQDTYIDDAIFNRLMPLLSFTILCSVINNTMFSVALPDVAEQFNLLPSQASWVVMGFIVLFALSSVMFGKLADKYEVKKLLMFGLLIFNAGLLLGFFSKSYLLLIIARYIQAVGSGSIPALMMIVATSYVQPSKRGKALGIIVASIAFGTGVGTIFGGLVINYWGWNYVFIFSLLSAGTLGFYNKWLPAREKKTHKIDYKGAILLALFIACLLIYINKLIWWLLFCSLLFVFLFWKHIHKQDEPFIRPQLLRNKKFTRGLLIAFLIAGTYMGGLFFFPLLLREVYGLNSLAIGIMLFPAAITAAVTGELSGRLADKVGTIPVVYTGAIVMMCSYLVFSFLIGSDVMLVSLALVFIYAGFTIFQSSMANTVSRTLPSENIGVGMGVYNLVYYMSGAVYTAISGKLLDYSHSAFKIVPYNQGIGTMYSNISIGFVALIAIAILMFNNSFNNRKLL